MIIYLSSLRKANNFSIYTNFYHCVSEYQKFTKLSKTKPPHNSPKFARKSSQKTSEKKLSYFERISNINGIRHVISIILHRKNVNFVTCVVTYFCKQKNIIPRNRLSFVLLFTSEWPATVMIISHICFLSCILLFVFFCIIYVDTIVYWEQTYLCYPNSSLPPLCMLSHHSFNVWKKYRKKKFTKNFEVKILKCTCSKFYSSSPPKNLKKWDA